MTHSSLASATEAAEQLVQQRHAGEQRKRLHAWIPAMKTTTNWTMKTTHRMMTALAAKACVLSKREL
jgi:hypothetical protein